MNQYQLERYERLRTNPSVVDVTAMLHQKVARLGFSHFIYWLLWPKQGPRLPVYATNYPEEWTRRHLALDYNTHDLVGRISAQTNQPFFWSSITRHRHLTQPQRLVFDEAAVFGLKAGAVVPLHGPGPTVATFCVVNDMAEREFAKLFSACRGDVELLARCAHERLRDLDMPDDETTTVKLLSPHEIAVLTEFAHGLTRGGVAKALSIREETVKTHLRSACRKLAAKNKTEAVAIAVMRGIIVP